MRSGRRKKGTTLVELLAAGVILSVSIAAIVSMFAFGFRVTRNTDDRSLAYGISRQELERIRSEGFNNTVLVKDSNGNITSRGRDGTETLYYNSTGTKLTGSTGAAYSVVITVTSDKLDTLSGGAQRPADDALRTVVLTVTRLSDSSVVFKGGTYLARSGV